MILVLVAVMLLSLAAWGFAEWMLIEAETSAMSGRSLQARLAAESGVEAVAARMEDRAESRRMTSPADRRPLRDVSLDGSRVGGRAARYSVTSASDAGRDDPDDESGRLNLHALPLDRARRRESRQRLLALPRMTPAIADAILDWLDEDDEPREFGAERNQYATLSPPRVPRNGRMHSLDELLDVRGVTPELFHGRESAAPFGSTSGTVAATEDAGWRDLLTLHSAEWNLRDDGRTRINLNSRDLPRLYDDLEREFGPAVAKFVVAYRMAGPTTGDRETEDGVRIDPADPEAVAADAERRARQQREEATRRSQPDTRPSTSAVRGGLDLSRGAAIRIRSPFDLFGNSVRITIGTEDTELDSPWSSDPSTIRRVLRALAGRVTTVDGPFIEGRVNVNTAPLPVLLSVPDMPPDVARAIIARQRGASGRLLGDETEARRHLDWLLAERLVDLPRLRRLAPHLTTRGDVVRFRVKGTAGGRGPVCRLQAMVDAARGRPRIVFLEELP